MICIGSKRDNTKKIPIKKVSGIFTPYQEGYVFTGTEEQLGEIDTFGREKI